MKIEHIYIKRKEKYISEGDSVKKIESKIYFCVTDRKTDWHIHWYVENIHKNLDKVFSVDLETFTFYFVSYI